MTSDELRVLLLSAADALDAGKTVYQTSVVTDVITKLKANQDFVRLAVSMLGIDEAKMTEDFHKFTNSIEMVEKLFGTPQSDELAATCRRLADRKLILKSIVMLI